VTAAISLILVYWAYDEVWVSLELLWRVWKKSHSVATVWRTFWGRPSRAAADAARELIEGTR
jgi:hypothetical protein